MKSADLPPIRTGIFAEASGLSAGWRAFLASTRPAAIYGAGRQATVVFDFCKMLGKSCVFLLTRDNRKRWGMLPQEEDLPLYLLDSIPSNIIKTDYDIIVAVNPKYNSEIRKDLQDHGWENIYFSDDWETDNAMSRSIFYREYLLRHGAYFKKDVAGHEILCYRLRERVHDVL